MNISSHNDINRALDVEKGTLLVHSFVTEPTRLSRHPVPSRIADHYLNFGPLSYPGEGREAQSVIFNPLNGHVDHFRDIGLLTDTSRYTFLEDSDYPRSNLELKLLSKIKGDPMRYIDKFGGLSLWAVFPSEITTEIAERAEMELLVDPDVGYWSNNKAALRENAVKYGYKVPAGLQFSRISYEDFPAKLNEILDFVQDKINRGIDIWMKYPTGSGGDLVKPIKASEYSGKSSGEIKTAVLDAIVGFAHSNLMSKSGDENVPKPSKEAAFKIICDGGLVVEDGVAPGYANFNAQMIIGREGRLTPINFSKQLTSEEGAYMGNMIVPENEYPDGTSDKIWKAMTQLGTYLHKEYGARMLYGADLLITKEGEVLVIDINSRPNGSTSQKLMASRLESKYSLNCNINLPFTNETYDRITQCLGKELLWTPENRNGVIPKMPRPRTPVVKIDILAEEPDRITHIRDAMRERGISF